MDIWNVFHQIFDFLTISRTKVFLIPLFFGIDEETRASIEHLHIQTDFFVVSKWLDIKNFGEVGRRFFQYSDDFSFILGISLY